MKCNQANYIVSTLQRSESTITRLTQKKNSIEKDIFLLPSSFPILKDNPPKENKRNTKRPPYCT
jgi:hypothetical protein